MSPALKYLQEATDLPVLGGPHRRLQDCSTGPVIDTHPRLAAHPPSILTRNGC